MKIKPLILRASLCCSSLLPFSFSADRALWPKVRILTPCSPRGSIPQTNIQTWSADFTQIRSLKALTPVADFHRLRLVRRAVIVFTGSSATRRRPSLSATLDQLMVIYPKLKRAERYSLGGAAATEWKDTLALLDAGFPRSHAEVESRFNILSQQTANGIHTLTLQPKSETARKFMPQIKISFDTTSFALHSTELQFQDGSTMENIFANPQLNPQIDDQLFHPTVEGYKIVEPFKK